MAGQGRELRISVTADTSRVESGLRGAVSALSGFGGVIAGAFAGLGALDFLAGAAGAAEEAAQANARLEQTLQNVGGAAADAAGRQEDLAGALSGQIGVDDDVIKAGQAILATFQAVGKTAGDVGGIFDRATKAGADLAAAGFGTIETNATSLGKALEDPIKGMSSLSRQGVTFTEAQKTQIETWVKNGEAAKAQDAILKVVEQQVGGTAAATVTSSQKMAVAWDNIQTAVGTLLMPVMAALADLLTNTIGPAVQQLVDWLTANMLPVMQQWAAVAGPILSAALASLGGFLTGSVIPAVMGFAGLMAGLVQTLSDNRDIVLAVAVAVGIMAIPWAIVQAAVLAYRAALIVANVQTAITVGIQRGAAVVTQGWAAAQALLNATMLANPIGLIIIAIAALVAAIVILWSRNEGFRDLVKRVWDAIKSAIGSAIDGIKSFLSGFSDKASAVFDFVKRYIGLWVSAITIYINVWKTVIGKAVDVVKAVFGFLVDKFDTVKSAFSIGLAAISAMFQTWKGAVSTVIDIVKGIFAALVDKFNTVKSAIGQGIDILKTAFTTWRTVVETVISAIVSVIQGIGSKFDEVRARIGSAIDTIKGIFSGWRDSVSTVIGAIGDIMDGFVRNFGGVRDRIKGVVDAIAGFWQGLRTGISGIFDGIIDGFVSALNGVLGVLRQAIELFNQLPGPDIPVPGLIGQSVAAQSLRSKSAAGSVNVTNNITVTGALSDPDGAARALAGVLSGRNLRNGLVATI